MTTNATEFLKLYHNIEDSIRKACKKPTLLEALEFVAICEMGRIVEKVRADPGPWDSCFGYCFKRVMDAYPMEIVKEVMNS